MSLAIVHSRALDGLAAAAVSVEVHLANGLPSFTLVGLAETEVKESRVSREIRCAQLAERRQQLRGACRPPSAGIFRASLVRWQFVG
jgi:hypothetical protein